MLGAVVALLALPWWPRPSTTVTTLRDEFGNLHRVGPVRWTVGLANFRTAPATDAPTGHPLHGEACWRWEAEADLRVVPEGRELLLCPRWATGRREVWPNHVPRDCRQVVMVDWARDDAGPEDCELPDVLDVYEVV